MKKMKKLMINKEIELLKIVVEKDKDKEAK